MDERPAPDHGDRWDVTTRHGASRATALDTPTFRPGELRERFLYFLFFALLIVPTYFTGIFAILRSGFHAGREYETNATLLMIGLLVMFAAMMVMGAAVVFKSMILYMASAQVRHTSSIPPWLRVSILFVPVFGAFWAFASYYDLARRQRQLHREQSIKGKSARPWLSLVWCLLGLLSWVALFAPQAFPEHEGLLTWAFLGLAIPSVLLWAFVVYDIKESAEAIAVWREDQRQAQAAAHGVRPARAMPLKLYQPTEFDTYYWLYFSFGVGAFVMLVSLVFAVVAPLLAIPGIVFKYMFVYKAWVQIQDGRPRTTPGKAVGFCFIPFFNLYWFFVAFVGLTQDLNQYTRRRGIKTPGCSPGLAITSCIFLLLTMIPYIGLIFILIGGPFWLLTLNDVRRTSKDIAAWKLRLTKNPARITISP